MFYSVIIGNEINTIIQAKPEIIAPVREKTINIIVLQAFLYREMVNDFAIPGNNIAAVQPGR